MTIALITFGEKHFTRSPSSCVSKCTLSCYVANTSLKEGNINLTCKRYDLNCKVTIEIDMVYDITKLKKELLWKPKRQIEINSF